MDHRSVSTYRQKECGLPLLSPIRVFRNVVAQRAGDSIPKKNASRIKPVRFPSLFRVRQVEEPCSSDKEKQFDIELPRISPKDLRIGECLGQSEHSRVFKALRISTGETLVVKYLSKPKIQLQDLSEYCRIFARLNKLAISGTVKYYGVIIDCEEVAICSEFVSEGSLTNGLDPTADRSLIRRRLSMLSSTLKKFHKAEQPHNNLKLTNILINCMGDIRLLDWKPTRNPIPCCIQSDIESLSHLVKELSRELGLKSQSAVISKQNERFENFDQLLDYFIPASTEGIVPVTGENGERVEGR